MSSAIQMFIAKVARERRIPFEISADPFESEDHIAMLEMRIADLKSKRNEQEHDLIKSK